VQFIVGETNFNTKNEEPSNKAYILVSISAVNWSNGAVSAGQWGHTCDLVELHQAVCHLLYDVIVLIQVLQNALQTKICMQLLPVTYIIDADKSTMCQSKFNDLAEEFSKRRHAEHYTSQ